MKKKDYLETALKFIKWNKLSSILLILFFTFIFLLGHTLINVGYNYDKYVEDSINKNILARTYFVFNQDQLEGKNTDLDKAVQNLRKIKHIIHSYNDDYSVLRTAKIMEITPNNMDNTISIKPVTNKFSPNISKGRKIKNENEIVCPRFLRKNADAKTKNDIVSMEKYLNKEITLNYVQLIWNDPYSPSTNKTFEKKVKLVGIFDNVLSLHTYRECYMLEEQVINMFSESKDLYTEKFLKDNYVYTDGTATVAIVDDLKNMESAREELNKAGYDIGEVGLEFDYNYINKIKSFSLTSFFILLIIIIIILNIYISIFMKKQKKQIGLCKTFGYTEKQLYWIYIIQIMICSLISFITSLFIGYVGILIFNKIISNNLEYFYIRLSFSLRYELIFLILLTLIIFSSSNKINKKINKNEIRVLFNETNI